MKGTYLGEFEELVLLIVGILNGKAYGINVMDAIKENTQRSVSVSTIHVALYRLEEKGFVESFFGGASKTRGGRKKRLYRITQAGHGALSSSRAQRESLWKLMPKFEL